MGIFDWKHWIVILIVVVLVFGTKNSRAWAATSANRSKAFARQ